MSIELYKDANHACVLFTDLVPDAAAHLVDVVHVARFDDLELASDIVSQHVVCWQG